LSHPTGATSTDSIKRGGLGKVAIKKGMPSFLQRGRDSLKRERGTSEYLLQKNGKR